MQPYGPMAVRLVLGTVGLVHGLADTFGLFDGPGITLFIDRIAALTSAAPTLVAWAVALGQLIGGILLLLGAQTRLVALLALLIAGGELWLSGRYTAFFVENRGCEYLLCLCAMAILLMCTGPGKWALQVKVKDGK